MNKLLVDDSEFSLDMSINDSEFDIRCSCETPEDFYKDQIIDDMILLFAELLIDSL